MSSNTRLQHVGHQGNSGGTNLAELLGVLSLATDLGMGQPMEHMLRQCLIALRLSDRLGLDESDRGVVYYTSLLAWVGCNVDAYEQAKWFGDEFVLKADARLVDFTGPAPPCATWSAISRQESRALHRVSCDLRRTIAPGARQGTKGGS